MNKLIIILMIIIMSSSVIAADNYIKAAFICDENGANCNDLSNGLGGGGWTDGGTKIYPSTLTDTVGIGTNNPSATLEVNGSTKARAISSGTPPLMTYSSTGTLNARIGSWSSNNAALQINNAAGTSKILLYSEGDSYITNNLGIGTTTPDSDLHIVASNAELRLQNSGSGGHAKTTYYDETDTAKFIAGYQDSTGNFGINTGSSFSNSGMTIDSSGNVGIGTSVPNLARLEISSPSVGSFRALAIGVEDVYGPRIYVDHETSSTNQYLEFDSSYSSGSGYADFIFQHGNIGIGITAPENLLHIYENDAKQGHILGDSEIIIEQDGTGDASQEFKLTGGQAYSLMIDNSDSDKIKMRDIIGNKNIWEYNPSTNDAGFTAGQVGIGTNNPELTLDVHGSFGVRSTSSQYRIYESDASDPLDTWHFSMNGLDLTNYFYDNSANTYLKGITQEYTGNVGIGTTTPDEKLTLPHSSKIGWEYSDASNGVYHTIGKGDGGGPMIFDVSYTSSLGNPIYQFDGSTDTIMSIDEGGSIGLGTTDPNARIDIKTLDPWMIDFDRTEIVGVDTVYNMGVSYSAVNEDFMFFGVDATINGLVITDDNKVGIGTNEPLGALEIRAVGSPYSMFRQTTTGGGGLSIGAKDNTANPVWAISTNVGEDVDFVLGGTTKMYINATSGNIGIGTTSPDANLEVVDTGDVKLRITGGTSANIYLTDTATTTDKKTFYLQSQNTKLYFGKANDAGGATDLMTLDNDGNIGIGTTTPDTRLTIKPSNNVASIKSYVNSVAGETGGIDFYDTNGGETLVSEITPDVVGLSVGNERVDLLFKTIDGGSLDTQLAIVDSKVGIGTITPTQKLDVNGQINVTGSNQRINFGNGGYMYDNGTTVIIGHD